MTPIEPSGVAPANALHHPTQPVRFTRGDEKHQSPLGEAVGMNGHAALGGNLMQNVAIRRPICFVEKDRLMVVSFLFDKMRQVGNAEAG